MMQVQVVIEIKDGTLSLAVNQLAREDANSEEREMAQAIEGLLTGVAEYTGMEIKWRIGEED